MTSKVNAIDEKKIAKENKDKKQQILDILSSKENLELEEKSPEELRKMLEEL